VRDRGAVAEQGEVGRMPKLEGDMSWRTCDAAAAMAIIPMAGRWLASIDPAATLLTQHSHSPHTVHSSS